MRSVPVPSSRTNFRSFLDFGTAEHSFTFTARKSDLLKVSKSTCSSKSGSIFTFEKSMLSFGVKKPHEFSAVSAFSPSACSPSESFPAPACAVPAFSAFADDADAPFSDEAAEAPLRSVGISFSHRASSLFIPYFPLLTAFPPCCHALIFRITAMNLMSK